MSKEVFSTNAWDLEFTASTADIEEVIITSISRGKEADTKELRSKAGKLIKRLVYDERSKYDLEILIQFKDTVTDVDAKLQDLEGDSLTLKLGAATVYAGKPNADSWNVKYSNEDYAVVSLSVTPVAGADIQQFA